LFKHTVDTTFIAKYNELKLNEWFTIQNELSALAKRQAEMKRVNRVQKILKKRIKNKEEKYEEIVKTRLVEADYNY
jgi:hypothetical protein